MMNVDPHPFPTSDDEPGRPGRPVRPVTTIGLVVLILAVILPTPPAAALAVGITASALGWRPAWAGAAARHGLVAMVFLIGCRMDFSAAEHVDSSFLVTGAIAIAFVIGVGVFCVSRMVHNRSCAVLISVGTAICGGSAITAVAPVIRARASEIGVAMGVVFACNGIALAVLPTAGRTLGLDVEVYALWCALAVHETSSVVSAASELGTQSESLATLGKIVRALCIVPVAIGFAAASSEGQGRLRACGRALRSPVLLAFGFAVTIVVVVPSLRALSDDLAELSRYGLRGVMVLTGLSVTWQELRQAGPRAFLGGLGLWIALAGLTLGLLLFASGPS